MRKLTFILFITILSSSLFTGCSTVSKRNISVTSSMLRTVGLGENSMPIDEASYAIEFFNDEAISINKINETFIIYYGEDAPDNEHYISGKIVKESLRSYGFNLRYGFDNSTEAKLGFLTGSIENGYSGTSSNSNSSNNSYTSLFGIQLGLKRLLTNYDNPHRLSLYAEGKYYTTSSEGIVDKYDGNILEMKAALIYGFLSDPAIRNFPSVAFYYSLGNTKRDNTIPGIPLEEEFKVVGLETNVSMHMGTLYPILALGVEKDIANTSEFDDLNFYLGVKLGLHFNRKK